VPISKGEGRKGMGKGKEEGKGGWEGEEREVSPCMRSHKYPTIQKKSPPLTLSVIDLRPPLVELGS